MMDGHIGREQTAVIDNGSRQPHRESKSTKESVKASERVREREHVCAALCVTDGKTRPDALETTKKNHINGKETRE